MMEVQIYNPGAQKSEVEGSWVQGHLWLVVSEFKANLGYMNSVSKKGGGLKNLRTFLSFEELQMT